MGAYYHPTYTVETRVFKEYNKAASGTVIQYATHILSFPTFQPFWFVRYLALGWRLWANHRRCGIDVHSALAVGIYLSGKWVVNTNPGQEIWRKRLIRTKLAVISRTTNWGEERLCNLFQLPKLQLESSLASEAMVLKVKRQQSWQNKIVCLEQTHEGPVKIQYLSIQKSKLLGISSHIHVLPEQNWKKNLLFRRKRNSSRTRNMKTELTSFIYQILAFGLAH